MISSDTLEWAAGGGFSGGGMSVDDIFSHFGDIFGDALALEVFKEVVAIPEVVDDIKRAQTLG